MTAAVMTGSTPPSTTRRVWTETLPNTSTINSSRRIRLVVLTEESLQSPEKIIDKLFCVFGQTLDDGFRDSR